MERTTDATVAALAVTVLTVLAGTAVFMTPAAAAPGAEQVCSDRPGTVLVGSIPGGPTSSNIVKLSGGSEIELYLCEDGQPLNSETAWSIRATDEFEIVATTEHRYRIRLAWSAEGTIDLTQQVQMIRGVTGLSVRSVAQPDVDSNLVDAQMTFPDEESARTYRVEERRYLDTVQWLRLNASSAAATITAENESASYEQLDRTKNLSKTLRQRRSTLLSRAYPAAWSMGNGTLLFRINQSASREGIAARRDARSALRGRLSQLRQARSDALGTVYLFGGVPLVVGLLGGFGTGWWLTNRKLERIAYDRTVTSEATFSWGQVVLQLAIGLAILVLTLVVAGLTVGLGTLVEGLL